MIEQTPENNSSEAVPMKGALTHAELCAIIAASRASGRSDRRVADILAAAKRQAGRG